jgi:hypothetical protein
MAAPVTVGHRHSGSTGTCGPGGPPPVPPTCWYVRGTQQVYGRSISRLPAALPIEARLRMVSIAEATSGPAFRTAGSALPGGGDDLLRIGLDLPASVFAPCLLGCPGTRRYQPPADGIRLGELRLSRQDVSVNMLVDCLNRTPEQRTLNPRVRGSSPWRRTRTDLGLYPFPMAARSLFPAHVCSMFARVS